MRPLLLTLALALLLSPDAALADPLTETQKPTTLRPQNQQLPKDPLTMAWVEFVRAHPVGTDRAHPALHADFLDWDPEDLASHIRGLRSTLRINYKSDFDDWGPIAPQTDAPVVELLKLSVTAEDYATYAYHEGARSRLYREVLASYIASIDDQDALGDDHEAFEARHRARLQKESLTWARRALQAIDIALALKHPTPGELIVERARTYTYLGEYDAAFAALEEAQKNNFKGLIWMKKTDDLAKLREQPRWAAWYAAQVPVSLREAKVDENFQGTLSLQENRSHYYSICADGRYLDQYWQRGETTHVIGTWSLGDGGMSLHPKKTCRSDGDTIPCEDIPAGDASSVQLLSMSDLVVIQQTPGYKDPEVEFKAQEPEFCRTGVLSETPEEL